MGWLDDLASNIESNLSLGSPIFLEAFDDAAKNCIAMISQPGTGNRHAAGIKTLHKTELGIRVRNSDMEIAEAQAKTLSDYLTLKTSFWAGTTWFKRITNDNGFYHVSTDSSTGTIYSLNCYVEFEE